MEYDMARGAPPAGGDPDPKKRDRAYRIYAQNEAIDGGMLYIGVVSPYAWTLLNSYYRFGLWSKRRGWLEVARELPDFDVPYCPGQVRCRIAGDDRMDWSFCGAGPKCKDLSDRFEQEIKLAITALFFAALRRQRRSP
jgi:hypothetical protein